jgi:hypothetical protein
VRVIITVFTSNQPRHIRLISELAKIADVVYAVVEVTTLFPGEVPDFFKKSDTMQEYFGHVMQAESRVFPRTNFIPANVRVLPMKSGDLNLLDPTVLSEALSADHHVVFGASYIKGDLAAALESRGALNIHMGLSPYYRGSSCNFWALYDNKPGYVGATIHLLTKGLDSGPMVGHFRPTYAGGSLFEFTMQAVKEAQDGLVRLLSGEVQALQPLEQDRSLEIRYSRNQEFNDVVAREFMNREVNEDEIKKLIAAFSADTIELA